MSIQARHDVINIEFLLVAPDVEATETRGFNLIPRRYRGLMMISSDGRKPLERHQDAQK